MQGAPARLLVLAVALAVSGCLGGAPPGDSSGSVGPTSAAGPQAIVALIDSGINAYHLEFRDHGPLAFVHPSTYIEGYPADAPALNLSLDEPDWETAIIQDCQLLASIQPYEIYWIPGTRIVGYMIDESFASYATDCDAGDLPSKLLDRVAPHGTGAASRAASANFSLCPDCRIFVHQASQTTHAMKRVSEIPWIDAQSNSWAGFFFHQVPGHEGVIETDRGPHQLAREATKSQVTFAGSGNGERVRIQDFVGAGTQAVNLPLGIPTYLRPAQGHAGVIVVGGHDNGQLILWPGTMPHVVADAWESPAAAWDSTDAQGVFGGTSGATPFAAGAFAEMVLEARRLVNDTGTGLRDGNLVVASPDATVPASGPLSDGLLSRQEAERLFLVAAAARPVEELPYDGTLGCPLTGPCFNIDRGSDTMVEWQNIPAGLPAYYFLGYGQAGVASLAHARQVLEGAAPLLPRDQEDAFFDADTRVRETLPD